jgi:hypothetical protein
MVPGMRKEVTRTRHVADHTKPLRVMDNFPADIPVSPSEIDAIEAFLMPLVTELLSGKDLKKPLIDSEAPQSSAPSKAVF